ncbi:MAG: 2OG-Fe dioxygenase family protein, partial [Mycobacterium sp.]
MRHDPIATATQRLTSHGVFFMPAADVASSLGVADDVWPRFSAHWDDLAPDRYAGELGMRRLRRYGHFRFKDGVAKP